VRYAICNETFGEWPLAEACEYAAGCGYTGIELAPFTLGTPGEPPTAIRPAARREIAGVIRAAGLECVGLHWLLAKTEGLHLTHPDAAVRRRTAAYLADLARLCGDLGGQVLVLGSPQQRSRLPGVTAEEAFSSACETLAATAEILADSETVLALEPLSTAETDVITTAAEARRVIDEVGSPWVRLHLDVKAMSAEAKPIPEVIRANADILAHFHANDPNLQGPGFGEVAFEPILAALDAINYEGWVSVEVFDYSPGVERLVTESIANLRAAESGLG